MNITKKLKLTALFLGLLLAFNSCADLSVENQNAPDRARALSNPADLVSLLQGATTDAMQASLDLWGVHMNGLSDQMTSTNKYLSFWDFTEEPRLRLNNKTTYADSDIFDSPWSTFNASISSANEIIGIVEGDGRSIVLEDGTDVTQKLLASAYFIRGFARGYLAMIYDKGYIVNYDTDVSKPLEPVPYTELMNAAIQDLDEAIKVADALGSGFNWDLLPSDASVNLNLAQFKTVTNSFAARILANTPRTASEASGWDWDSVISYAEKGVGGTNAAAAMEDFSASSIANQFYNNYADWSCYMLGDGSGYLPSDIKIIHMLDPGYPVEYPAAPTVLDSSDVNTNDPRIGYYNYSSNFGYLSASRNRSLFSNYLNLRLFSDNQMYNTDGYPVTFFIKAETQYILAEAYLMKNNKTTAAQYLMNSPFGNGQTDVTPNMPSVQLGYLDEDGMSGGNSISGTDSDQAFVRALHREYSVELDLIDGIGLQWFYMRRHDLLQKGTALHYAIPGSELEITGRKYYTYGGNSYSSNDGTASGSNSWKTFDQTKSMNKVTNGTRYHSKTFTPEQLNLNLSLQAGKYRRGNN